ncbi:MAG: polysulfide reductase NrfD [Desulfatibacillum sp.]|nr:polysulfide reductase NrfD [Desulfatibacillum sp.]
MNRTSSPTPPGLILLRGLAFLGLAAIIYRFWVGIGAVANLSDGYPWGLWVAIDILAGVALAAGGFVVAGLVYIFGGKQFAGLARPAVLTAFLGYLMFVLGLVVDMGRPWHMFYIFIGNHQSPLYEIGWCAFLYTLVLALELLPPVFERFSMDRAYKIWQRTSPWLVVALLSLFTWAMTFSLAWTLAVASILLGWELMMEIGVMGRKGQTPVLLIAAGVMLSFLHQSSLGSLYLMTPHTLNPLWHSPILPVLFLVSAIVAGIAMIILESLAVESILGHKTPLEPLFALAYKIPILLIVYAALKIGDILLRGQGGILLTPHVPAAMWWVEMSLGVFLPLALYVAPGLISKRAGLAVVSVLVVAGLVVNRVNVAIVGVEVQRWHTYYPSFFEIFITLGILSMGLLAYTWATSQLPIHDQE